MTTIQYSLKCPNSRSLWNFISRICDSGINNFRALSLVTVLFYSLYSNLAFGHFLWLLTCNFFTYNQYFHGPRFDMNPLHFKMVGSQVQRKSWWQSQVFHKSLHSTRCTTFQERNHAFTFQLPSVWKRSF